MTRPAWFIATLLAMLGGLLVSHLTLLRGEADSCAAHGALLRKRYSETPVGSPAAASVTARIEANLQDCEKVEERFSKASSNYQSTVLGLLGGAGMGAAAGSAGQRARRGTRRTDEDGVPSITLKAAPGATGATGATGEQGERGEAGPAATQPE